MQGLNALLQSHTPAGQRAYILSIVGAAVRGNATKFEASTGTLGVELTFDGDIVTRAHAEALLSGKTAPAESWLADLVTAFAAAHVLRPGTLKLVVWDGTEGFCLDMLHSRLELIDRPDWAGAKPSMRFILQENYDSGLVEQKAKAGTQESSLLKLARFAPLDIRLNDSPLNEDLLLAQDSASLFAWTQIYHQRATVRAAKPKGPNVYHTEDSTAAANFEAVLCLDIPAQVRQNRLWLLCDGVLFERPAQSLNIPFAYGLISAPFNKTENHLDIVEDQLYKHVLSYARNKAEDLLLERLDQFIPFEPATVKMIKDWAPVLVSRFTQREQEEKAKILERWSRQTL